MLEAQRKALLDSMAPTERREYVIAEQGRRISDMAGEISGLKTALRDAESKTRKATLEEAVGRIDCLINEQPSSENATQVGFGVALGFAIAKDELNYMAEGKQHRTVDQIEKELLDHLRGKKAKEGDEGKPDASAAK